MIHRGGCDRSPTGGKFFVTGIAHITAGDMTCAFPAGEDPIVTSNAVVHKRRVIYSCRNPLLRIMTIVTFLGGGNMVRAFACSCHVVVTTGTNTQHFIVIYDADRSPGYRRGLVTGFARIGGTNVVGSFAGADTAIVTRYTAAGDLVMIQRRDKR